MIFVDYWHILIFVGPIALVVLGIWGHRSMRSKKDLLIWLPARIATLLVVCFSSIFFLFVGCGSIFTITTHSNPIFSPDHKLAARVTFLDGGALGGDTSVSLYSAHGLRNGIVLTGHWKVVEEKDVHWLSNSEVLLAYPDYGYHDDPPYCHDYGKIKVTCRPVITSSPSR